jgi:hypothetical protein
LQTYTLYGSTPNSIKETLLKIKSQIDPDTIIVSDFNTPFSPIGRSTGQKKSTRKS